MSKVNIKISCVGMRHRVTPTTLQQMSEVTPLHVILKRDPGNLHDANAIAVYLRDKPWRDFHVGYITRQVASELAPRWDRGEINFLDARIVSIDPESGMGELEAAIDKL